MNVPVTTMVRNLFAASSVLLATTMAAQAATYTVTTTAGTNDGVCDAHCTLIEAVAVANATADDDVIDFAVDGTITLGGAQLALSANGKLTIDGPGADRLTVSGNNDSRVFYIAPDADVTLNGMTVTGGDGTGNFSDVGGGIYNDSGTLTLNYVAVTQNMAQIIGGGIFNRGVATLNHSTVSGNATLIGEGGGIYSDGDDSTQLLLNNSTVSGNRVNVSGHDGTPVGGGGLWVSRTTIARNTTISQNEADYAAGFFHFGGRTRLYNSIVANNVGFDQCNGNFGIDAWNTFFGGNSSCVNGTDSNNLLGDPMLGPLEDNGGPTGTHALQPGSPAIDAGDNALIPTDAGNLPVEFDQRGDGFPRVVNATVDMGAFEYAPADADNDGVPDDADLCPDTVIPELDSFRLKKNRFAVDADGNFVDGKGVFSGYTIGHTDGCSAVQIIEALGLGAGHARFGITESSLEYWIAMLPRDSDS